MSNISLRLSAVTDRYALKFGSFTLDDLVRCVDTYHHSVGEFTCTCRASCPTQLCVELTSAIAIAFLLVFCGSRDHPVVVLTPSYTNLITLMLLKSNIILSRSCQLSPT